ncbi:MAG: hypothetical protein PHD76_00260 [Methylacidiphilales bacterium]|nr:hypothetical protein [Candidatus Methylacidiphilales bacterium]
MSYDLYFTSPKISREEFTSYFRSRSSYEVSDQQALYQNQDTGVYFSFDYTESEPVDEGAIKSSAAFNLNFYRPHFFALEAVDEVTAFVEHFKFLIHDPQNDGMENGPYSPEVFLKGWNHGNEFGYAAVLQQHYRRRISS